MQHTSDPDHTGHIISQGRALVRAIEALDNIETSRPFEGELAELLRSACQRCLRCIVADAPSWVREEILKPDGYVQDVQPDRGEAPADLAYPSPATSPAPTACDPGQDGKTSGDGEHAGRKQYPPPTLTKPEGKRSTRTVAI